MSPIAFLDLAAAAGSVIAAAFFFLGRRGALARRVWIILSLILALTVCHDFGNFLEWSGISPAIDPVTDGLKVLTAVLWGIFFYTLLQASTENALRQSEEKYRRLFEVGNDVIIVYQVEEDGEPGLILEANEVARKRLGYTKEELLAMTPRDLHDPEIDCDMSQVMETLVKNEPAVFRRVQVARDGRRIPVEVNAQMFHLGGKRVVMCIARDITKRLEDERTITELRLLDEKILATSPVAFVLHDPEMRVVRVSRAYGDVTGFDPDQVLGRKLEEFMPEGPQKKKILENLRRAAETGLQVGPEEIQSPIPGKFIRETIIPVFSPEGKVANILSVLEDITERKNEADERKKSEQKYRILFENIQDGVVVCRFLEDGRMGNFIQANAAFFRLSGYGEEELFKLTPEDITDSQQREDSREMRSNLLAGKTAFFERNLYTKSGKEVQCEIRSDVLELGDEKVVLSVCHDVTQRVLAERRMLTSLKEKEVLLREIHHRVKNNLQVISGLLNLQSYFIDDQGAKGIFRESQNRIKAMAMIHEELYRREDLSFVNLSQYLGDLARNLFASYSVGKEKVRLVMDLEDARIVLDTAVPCGLIVNELMSNALKHAFPGNRKGEIRVVFRRSATNTFSLSVSDDGIGLPADFDPKTAKTMGIQLVRVLSEQLGGKLQHSSGDGASFLVEFSEYRENGLLVSVPSPPVS